MTTKQSNAATHEPPPTGNGTAIITELLSDLLNRNKAGTLKYGTTLKTNNGRDALMDAYQESCDLCMYLKQALMERDIAAEQADINFSMADFQPDDTNPAGQPLTPCDPYDTSG